MKKEMLYASAFIFVIFLITFVSAYSSPIDASRIKDGSQTVIDFAVNWASPFLQAILGGNDYTGYLLFEKFLLFILFFTFIWLSVGQVKIFNDQKAVKVVIAFVVGVLAIRYMDFIWINTIIMNYQILGIAVTSIIPFVIYFFFLQGFFPENSTLRKIGWIFLMVVYFGLYFTITDNTYGSVYFWTGVVAFLFLLMDGTIQKAWYKQKYKDSIHDQVRMQISKVMDDIDLLEKRRPPGYEQQVKMFRMQLDNLYKYLKR